jgi:TonB family protein
MIAYIFKSSLSLILLFGLYWFLLRKEKLFIFNRFFLVLSVIFSLILPFISVPVNFQTTHELENIIPISNYIIPEIKTSENIVSQDIIAETSSVEIKPSIIGSSTILGILYISGAILFLLRFLKNIYHIYRQIKLSEKIRFEGYRLLLTNEKTNPYCFFNNIFLNRNDYLNGRIDNDLINHELMHITQYHSVDIIFLELIKIFYWFNPVHILYDRAIRINHEYLADYGVIHDDYDIKNYSDKLLSFIFTRSNIPLISGSNNSFTKKRLLMITKTKSKSSVYGFRIAITISLILVFSLFLSFKKSNIQPSNDEPVLSGLTDLQAQTVKDKDEIYVKADKMPQYPGGDMALRKFIMTNMNYPEEARAQKAEGVVILRFVVNTEGNIEDVKLLQKVHPAIDTEALRVVGKLGRFIPGSQGGKLVKVYYNLSLTFALSKTNTP